MYSSVVVFLAIRSVCLFPFNFTVFYHPINSNKCKFPQSQRRKGSRQNCISPQVALLTHILSQFIRTIEWTLLKTWTVSASQLT